MSAQLLISDILKEVDRRIKKALAGARVNLKQTTGALPVSQVPSGIPGSRLGAGTVTPTELSFDPATQAELDAHAADTTSVHGIADTAALYRAGGTDVALSDGGTGASLSDPGADRILFWDDSANSVAWLTPGTNLAITGTTLDASGSGGGTIDIDDGSTTVPSATSLSFVGGTVVDLGGGAAEYTPPSGSGGTISTNAYASPPGSPADGDVWIPSDSPYTAYRVSGAWQWRYKGGPITLPDATSFSWVNQGGAVLTNNGGALNLLAPADATSNLRLRAVSTPGATFKLRVGLARMHYLVNFPSSGIFVRDSGSGKIINFAHYQGPGIMIQEYSAATGGFVMNLFGTIDGIQPDYFEIEETVTDRIFRVGRLGMTMMTVFSHAVGTYLTTDQCGFYVDANHATYDAMVDVWDFQLT